MAPNMLQDTSWENYQVLQVLGERVVGRLQGPLPVTLVHNLEYWFLISFESSGIVWYTWVLHNDILYNDLSAIWYTIVM